ncbi:MAG: rhodanese-like domain-containing protein [Flavobacteriaceae bacterium]
MGFFNFMGGGSDTNAIKEYLDKGGVILDVRTPAEWAEGHTKGAKLITLNDVPKKVNAIKAWNKPVVVVCRSGGRAGSALSYLQNAGVDAINGGAWQNADI